MLTTSRMLDTARIRRAPQPRRVTIAMAAALAVSALAARRFGIAVPLAWLLLGLVWLAVRVVMFERADVTALPVVRWRFGPDIASPSLDLAPEDNLVWPVFALPATGGTPREMPAAFGFYLYEFRERGMVEAELPDALLVRVVRTPVGSVVMPDDRSFALVGPSLFVAVMALAIPVWAAIQSVVPALAQ